jgi:hypothetical protein
MQISWNVFHSKSSHHQTEIMLMPNMTPEDVIRIIRVQSQNIERNLFGLMISDISGMCTWINERVPIGTIVVDRHDRIFVHPYTRMVTVHLPDQRSSQVSLNQKLPVAQVTEQLCRKWSISPAIVWGLYMRARNEHVLLLRELSLGEQAPEVLDIHMRQFYFPVVRSAKPFIPLSLYLVHYRHKCLDNELGTGSADQQILQRKPWFIRKDPAFNLNADPDRQVSEFMAFSRFLDYGTTELIVRVSISIEDLMFASFVIRKLRLRREGITIVKNSDVEITRPLQTLTTIGLQGCDVLCTFQSDERWLITSHRATEIVSIVRFFIRKIPIFPTPKNVHSLIAMPEMIAEPRMITGPKGRYIPPDVASLMISKAITSAGRMMRARQTKQFNEKDPQEQLVVTSLLAQLSESCENRKVAATARLTLNALKTIHAPAASGSPLSGFAELERALRALNLQIGKGAQTGTARNLATLRQMARMRVQAREISPPESSTTPDCEDLFVPAPPTRNLVVAALVQQRKLPIIAPETVVLPGPLLDPLPSLELLLPPVPEPKLDLSQRTEARGETAPPEESNKSPEDHLLPLLPLLEPLTLTAARVPCQLRPECSYDDHHSTVKPKPVPEPATTRPPRVPHRQSRSSSDDSEEGCNDHHRSPKQKSMPEPSTPRAPRAPRRPSPSASDDSEEEDRSDHHRPLKRRPAPEPSTPRVARGLRRSRAPSDDETQADDAGLHSASLPAESYFSTPGQAPPPPFCSQYPPPYSPMYYPGAVPYSWLQPLQAQQSPAGNQITQTPTIHVTVNSPMASPTHDGAPSPSGSPAVSPPPPPHSAAQRPQCRRREAKSVFSGVEIGDLLSQIETVIDQASEQVQAGKIPLRLFSEIKATGEKLEAASRDETDSGSFEMIADLVQQLNELVACEPSSLKDRFEIKANGIFELIQTMHEKRRIRDRSRPRAARKAPRMSPLALDD